MSVDNTYKYFLKALEQWIKKTGYGHKKLLSLGCECGKSQITQLLNPDRKNPIPFHRQVQISETCGMPYIEFLQHGKALLKGNKTPQTNQTTSITKKHQELISDFKDKKEAIEINQNLIKLEKLDIEAFHSIAGLIKGKVKKMEGGATSGNGTFAELKQGT